MPGNPRNGRPYRRLVAALKARGLPCWICGHAINPRLDAWHRLSFTLDHIQPLSLGGDLLDPANARPAHRACNSGRGNRTRPPRSQQRTSKRW
ncbi:MULTISPECIES: HNH endonuclease [unclassified Streptomyces]|uniref:HNH endonuclease n=1 Tax=unclassified Streptomyces TaxID=2593676 RepID=UPI0016607253|nr:MULTISPECIES: HNH endonuclease [unclassified Streptomyces]MBD0707383.1 HNH endonuclease [Streptomyces sp. CBMA291]MBD0715165.1 HNH endonuclease [Streptomyces sp. CBMA370]